ncbi:MAG TPA: radical SAM family heme chaperone HemW [Clostridia bacterium]|nr:radical SAM family heme chaperone HemW [Clostridia bacterium]
MENKEIGLYIHIPFCKSKCHYCDFNSFSGRDSIVPAYFDSIKREITLYSDRLKSYTIKTIFLGGGTPSYIDPHYIYEVMNLCRKKLDITSNAEISIETNPGTLTYEKLIAYKDIGINRLSIGLQAWQNHILKGLGRIHTNSEYIENFYEARKAGFSNINTDLIFGLPGQTLKDWNETLERVIELKPEHLSCYSLKIEEGTEFGRLKDAGKLEEIEDELDREMYYMAIEKLKKEGFSHYEISNFAKPGYECKHNMIYWRAEEYIGFGAGAHSYFQGKRYNNASNPEEYSAALNRGIQPLEDIQEIDREEQMSEYMLLGLRLIEGIDCLEFESRFNANVFSLYGDRIAVLCKKKLLETEERFIRLTPKGLDFANEVFMEFV